MKVKLTRLLSTLTLATLGLILIASLALAIDSPDALQINSVYAFQHCLETNDQLYIVEYSIDYDPNNPEENITEAYLGRLIDGVDELKAVAPYAYYDEGYDEGIFAIYFSSSDSNLPTWEGIYTMKLEGNPTLTWLGTTASTAMGGAVAYDAPAYTDETAVANSVAADDMTLLPAVPVVNDAYYFGDSDKFSILKINIGINGAWVGYCDWEYWNGLNWVTADSLTDGTDGFRAGTGNYNVTFIASEDWEETTVDGTNLYWIRVRVTSYTGITTQPKGTQSWTNSTPTAPPTQAVTIFDLWSSSTSITQTQNELTSRILYIADQLELAWGINMVDSTGTGSYLSDYGEAYFTNAISNIQAMAPKAFAGSTTQPQWEYKEPTTDYADSRIDDVTDTPLDMEPVAEWWGISRMWASSLCWMLGSIFILYCMLSPTSNYRPLVLLGAPLIIAGGYLGMLPLILTILMGFAAFALSIFILFYHPSGV